MISAQLNRETADLNLCQSALDGAFDDRRCALHPLFLGNARRL
jgi:hypothetical protein